jgi:acetyl-CoA carboxylase biotin carboxyl carrier protein
MKKKTPVKSAKKTAKPAPKAAKGARPAGGLDIDTRAIRDLAKILEETGLSEITWAQGDTQVKVARTIGGAVALPAAIAAAPVAAPAAAAAPATDDPGKHPGAVKSPMVGTAYLAPEPGAATFVSVGDSVKQGQTLLIIEAMKTMNPIPAPKAGKVVQILVSDKQPVEFGQPLLIVE